MALSAGTRLGPYEILAPLGAGGMGEVYRAQDTRLGRRVAVKVLPAALTEDHDRLRRFEQEARLVAALNHPNVLTVHDVGTARPPGTTRDVPYLVMELLDGQTLRESLDAAADPDDRARCRPLRVDTAVAYGRQIADGIAAAHAAGIVHRDLKPENIFITHDGRVKILDFGLAKLALPLRSADTATGTQAGMVLGTVGYMAPEQVRGEPVDGRADLFAFGAVLYELATGCRAFRGGSVIETLSAILHTSPSDLSPSVDALPPPLAQIVRRCLAKSPDDRFQSATEIVDALERAAAEVSLPSRRRGLAAWIAVALMAAIGSATWWLSDHPRGSRTVEPPTSGQPSRFVVAVVPFSSIAEDASRKYFADGMTEEISAQLSRLSSLRVMSRTAVARYTESPASLRRIGPELGVGRIVTGTVRVAGSRARIDVQLVDAKTDQTVWSDQYDRDLQDILAVQSDVARRIAVALQGRLSVPEQQRLGKAPTDSVRAYELYLRARSGPDPKQLVAAIEILREAVRLDSRFSVAYARLAVLLGFLGDATGRQYYAEALAVAQQAVQADPAEARAHHAMAVTYLRLGRMADSRLSFLRAADLDPNFFAAFFDLSVAEQLIGHFDQSLYWARRGFQVAPNVDVSYYHVGLPMLLLGADAVTERWLLEAERRFPTFQRIQLLLASQEFLTGRAVAAVTRLKRSVEAEPNNPEGLRLFVELAVLTDAPDALDRTAPLFQRDPDMRMSEMLPETIRTLHAYLLSKRGDPAASKLLNQALMSAQQELQRGSEDPVVPMEIAAIYALRKDPQAALQWVDAGYKAGWRMYRETLRDPLFATVKDDPKFRSILQKMEADVAAMRARADVSANPTMPPVQATQPVVQFKPPK
jgi:serine/threonine protein kinase/tetratricopeptide (TPR) repeat protein